MDENEKIFITAQEIGEMLLFADDVLEAMDMNAAKYDDNGIFVLSKYDSADEAMTEITENMADLRSISFLYDLYRDDNFSLDDVRGMDAGDILKLIPGALVRKAVGVFRNGVEYDPRRVSEDISDRYLSELFAMKVREMMILFAAKRMTDQ